MSYGQGVGKLDVSFSCDDCGVEITIRLPVGKDYIFDETVSEAFNRIHTHCKWDCHDWREGPIPPIRCAACIEREEQR